MIRIKYLINRIVNVKSQYMESLNCVQIEILELNSYTKII